MLASGMMLCGWIIALGAVICAFFRGGGRRFAWVAYALVVVPPSLMILTAGELPRAAGLVAFGSLGLYGYLARHRQPPSQGHASSVKVVLPVASSGPTEKAVAPGDVLGEWRFYVDAVGKTVSVTFRADGTYLQTILPNQGPVTDLPGGRWSLESPFLLLCSYHSASRGSFATVRWWFADTCQGLRLNGTDGPDTTQVYQAVRVEPAD